MTGLVSENPGELYHQTRWAYLHDAQFHQDVDVATNRWWLGISAEHAPLPEFKNIGREAIAVALHYERMKRAAEADV